MSERVLNQAVYSLIKEPEVRTDRRVKGRQGASASASAVQGVSMGQSASTGQSASAGQSASMG